MTNRLSRFRAKSKEIKLSEDDDPLTIKGLTFSELADFSQFVEKGNIKGALELMLFVTLRKALPTEGADAVSDNDIKEEIRLMDSSVALKVVDSVRELSGISLPEDKKKDTSITGV